MKQNTFTKLLLCAGLFALAGCSDGSQPENPGNPENPATQETEGSDASTSNSVTPVYPKEDIEAMSDEEMYMAARTAVLYHAAYDHDTYADFANAWVDVDLNPTVNEVLAAIESQDEEMMAKMETLRSTFMNLNQIANYEDVTMDLWEGHDAIPWPNDVEYDHYGDAQACLCDDPGFRPFISDYRLDNPETAKGTILVTPSIRSGGHSEMSAIADIFNENGYNVFTIEGRMDAAGDFGYDTLSLDTQRAIRYLRYHADELGIDDTKFVNLAGSKGNMSHPFTYNYYNMTPTEYLESKGGPTALYTDDEIDKVYSNVAALCVNYGSAGISGFGIPFTEDIITGSAIYSAENYEQGLKFPDICMMEGNLDSSVTYEPDIINGLWNYNQLEDKLYPVNFEVHIFNNVPHGFGAGLDYPNLTAGWSQIATYLDTILNPAA